MDQKAFFPDRDTARAVLAVKVKVLQRSEEYGSKP